METIKRLKSKPKTHSNPKKTLIVRYLKEEGIQKSEKETKEKSDGCYVLKYLDLCNIIESCGTADVVDSIINDDFQMAQAIIPCVVKKSECEDSNLKDAHIVLNNKYFKWLHSCYRNNFEDAQDIDEDDKDVGKMRRKLQQKFISFLKVYSKV
jgi:hypothetical protein